MAETAPKGADGTSARRVVLILVAAAIVTAALAVFGVEHTPDYSFSLFGTGVGRSA